MISWRRALRTIPCLAVLLAAGRVSAALSPSGTAAPGRQESTHRMIVKIRDRAESGVKVLSSERVSKLSASSREKLTFFRGMSGRAHVMKLPRKMSLDEAQAVAKRLMADPDVEYAEPDIRRYPALVPTDPQYGGSQWHYYAPATEKAGANLPSAWDITTGAASVVVAVLDTGILTHADIDAGRLVQGYDFISQDGSGLYYTANDGSGRDSDPSDPGDWISVLEDAGTDPVSGDFFQGCGVDDSSWHGTHVTGTIGATPNNAAYGAGVDWTSKILPVRVLGKCGGYDSDIVDGIRWAAGGSVVGVPANANPAKVINMSIQGAGMCPASYQSAINDAIAAGAVIVAAAGNAGGAAAGSPPGNCNGVITVAAVNRAGNRASYSNYGPEVEVSAPGGEGADGVYSLLNTGLTIPVADTGVELNGTSMAAPHVSGIVALMRAFNSSLTPANVLTDLQACSRPFVGGSTCDTSNCGAGMIDARGALRPGVPTGSAVTAATPNSITWTWNAVANAPSYNVYVATDPSVMLGNTAAASFTRSDLTPNIYTGIIVKASNTVCAGGPAVSPSTATTAEASGVTAATPWVSSMTATFNEVLTSNSGYRVDASTASDFTGTVFSTASAVYPASTKLTVPGLTSLTSYYLRIAVLNQLGNETRTAYGSQVYTLTSLTAPGPGSFSDYGTRQLRLSWTAGGNPSGLAYTAQASTASNFTGTVSSAAGTDLFQNLFTGLQVNTSYYFRVWPAGGPSWSPGPVATYALSPSTATPLFSAVADQALTVSWTSGGNPAGTVYEAQVSRGADFFSQVVVSSFTRNSSAGFTGLTSNSVYYARVRAVSHGGQPAPTAYRSLSSTGTLASPVSPTAPFFQAVSNESFLALFDSGANAAGTGYVAQLSTASDFSVIHAQVSGVMSAGSNAAPFAGLESNRRYYLQTAALNVTGTPTAFSQAALPADRSTATFPAPPASSSSTVYFTSITFVWSSGNRTGTTYDILVDGDPGFGSPDASATTSLSSAAVSLSSNTVYYARVRARALEPGNPDTSYVDLSPAYTLPEPPSADPPAFLSVTFTSATVRWQARPVSPPAASSETCSGYRIQLSSAQSFTGTVHSADVAGAASTGGSVAGLAHSTTYYLRVGSLNADGAAAYTLMGSTRTLVPQISSSPVTGSTELSVTPPYPEVRFIRVSIAEKTFAVGTPVELNTSVAAELPPLAGQAEFAFIGAGAGFSLSAGGLQPTKPIPITIGYELPVGVDDRLLMLARYDDTSHKWLTLPSSLDRGAKTLTGLVDHFSFFAPLIVQPGTDVSAVEIYPIPWEPESGDSLHGGSVLTISRLPAQARVRVYTNTGELLDEGTAGASGVLHWDGRNTRGHRVGTGTYLVVIESDGAKTVRSAAVIR